MLRILFFASLISLSVSCNSDKNNNAADNNSQGDVIKQGPVSDPLARLNEPAVKLKTDMRKLWEDHTIWTRNVILNIMDGLPGTDEAVERLLKNQDDISDAIKPYYGEDAAKKLDDLLHTHITTAADLLKAARANNNDEFKRQDKLWHDNADQIAKFLSDANTNWGYNDMKKMMDKHLELTTNEAVDRQKKNYKDDVKDFDKVREEILEMSDMLTEGIIRQFPDKFPSAENKMAGL